MARGTKRACPACGSTRIVRIFYGLPTQDSMDDVLEASRRGEIELGGCTVSDDDPEWHCKACGNEWRPAAVIPPAREK